MKRTNSEIISAINRLKCGNTAHSCKAEYIQIAIECMEEMLDKKNADGCDGCAHVDVREWELPCAKCSRCNKDYYRFKR